MSPTVTMVPESATGSLPRPSGIEGLRSTKEREKADAVLVRLWSRTRSAPPAGSHEAIVEFDDTESVTFITSVIIVW